TWVLLAMWLVDASNRLPPLTAETFALWLGDGGTNGRWLLPILVNVALSFAFAKRFISTFDKVSVGGRALHRYRGRLALVCDESWGSPELERLQAALGGRYRAPAMLKKLARLAQWSELRSGAAILHIVIQALTLWDFHIVFALEQWRTRVGHSVRGWL